MPSVVSKLHEIGQFIILHEENLKWFKIICGIFTNLFLFISIYMSYVICKKKKSQCQKEQKTDKNYEVLSEADYQ